MHESFVKMDEKNKLQYWQPTEIDKTIWVKNGDAHGQLLSNLVSSIFAKRTLSKH